MHVRVLIAFVNVCLYVLIAFVNNLRALRMHVCALIMSMNVWADAFTLECVGACVDHTETNLSASDPLPSDAIYLHKPAPRRGSFFGLRLFFELWLPLFFPSKARTLSINKMSDINNQANKPAHRL